MSDERSNEHNDAPADDTGAVVLALRETHVMRQGNRTVIVSQVTPGPGIAPEEADAILGPCAAEVESDFERDFRELCEAVMARDLNAFNRKAEEMDRRYPAAVIPSDPPFDLDRFLNMEDEDR